MSFEQPHAEPPKRNRELAAEFRGLVSAETPVRSVFSNLETALVGEGFSLADANAASEILASNTLLCRSENFTKVLDLLTLGTPIEILNREHQANMCSVASGSGFRVAMTEGFSGEDVGDTVKTVITFRGEHLTERSSIPHSADLWQTKPQTAQVSLAGRGTVMLDDIEMVSFRFPVHLFPEELLTEEEREQLEDSGIHFIVRHYVPRIEKTTH